MSMLSAAGKKSLRELQLSINEAEGFVIGEFEQSLVDSLKHIKDILNDIENAPSSISSV